METGAPNGSTTKQRWSVEEVIASIPGGPPATDSESPVPFFHILERLKTTKREGWRRFGIDRYVLADYDLCTQILY